MLKFELNVAERKTLAKRMEELTGIHPYYPKHLCILTTLGATPSTGMATFWSSRRMQMPSC